MDNRGLRIVLTGATRGLGLALTERFCAEGHTLAGCGRSEERIGEMKERFPEPNRFAAVDVTDAANGSAWAEDVLDAIGPPDLLINNAGLINRPAPLWEVPEEEFSAVVDVNLKGVANTIRAFVPAMIDRGSGIVVNLSSGWGRSTSAHVAPYCTTKWGIEGLTQALSQELPRGMAAIAVNPGIIDTEMLRTCFGREAANYPTPSQWAERAVPFLLGLSPKNNGKAMTVA